MAQLAATGRDLQYAVLCSRFTLTHTILACSLDVCQYTVARTAIGEIISNSDCFQGWLDSV